MVTGLRIVEAPDRGQGAAAAFADERRKEEDSDNGSAPRRRTVFPLVDPVLGEEVAEPREFERDATLSLYNSREAGRGETGGETEEEDWASGRQRRMREPGYFYNIADGIEQDYSSPETSPLPWERRLVTLEELENELEAEDELFRAELEGRAPSDRVFELLRAHLPTALPHPPAQVQKNEGEDDGLSDVMPDDDNDRPSSPS